MSRRPCRRCSPPATPCSTAPASRSGVRRPRASRAPKASSSEWSSPRSRPGNNLEACASDSTSSTSRSPASRRRLAPTIAATAKAAEAGRRHLVHRHGPLLPDGGLPHRPRPDARGLHDARLHRRRTTERMQARHVVTGVTYRHPGLLAKIATTLDVLRGPGLPRHRRRLVRARAPGARRAVPADDGALRAPRGGAADRACRCGATTTGPTRASTTSSPRRSACRCRSSGPHPPIVIGGGGEKKTLRLVAKYADACNLIVYDATRSSPTSSTCCARTATNEGTRLRRDREDRAGRSHGWRGGSGCLPASRRAAHRPGRRAHPPAHPHRRPGRLRGAFRRARGPAAGRHPLMAGVRAAPGHPRAPGSLSERTRGTRDAAEVVDPGWLARVPGGHRFHGGEAAFASGRGAVVDAPVPRRGERSTRRFGRFRRTADRRRGRDRLRGRAGVPRHRLREGRGGGPARQGRSHPGRWRR